MLRIGELSKLTCETVKTLRYWTDYGLLDSIRSTSGYRYFEKRMCERVTFIRKAQSLGFKLDDIIDIIKLREDGLEPCDHVREHLSKQLETVQEKLAEMQSLEKELQQRLEWANSQKIDSCDSEGCVYLQAEI